MSLGLEPGSVTAIYFLVLAAWCLRVERGGPPDRLLAGQYTELLLAFGPLPPALVPGGSLNSLGLPPPEFILTKAALD